MCYTICIVCLLHVSATLMAILREVHLTKSEFLPIICIEDGQRYSCTLSLTRTLEGVGGQLYTRSFYSPVKSPVIQWASRTVWTGAEKIAPTGFEPQTVQIVVSCYTAHAIKAPLWLPIRTEKESDKPMHLQALCHTFYLNTFQLAYPAAWVAISHWTSMQHRTTLLTESQAFLKSINSGWTSPLYLHFITHTYLSWFQASAAV